MPQPAPSYSIERVETAAGLQEEIDLRIEVFHREQGFSVELEVDEHDVVPGPTAHFVIRLQAHGAVVGTVAIPFAQCIGANRPLGSRKYGFGSILVRHAEQWALSAAAQEGGLQTVISSQEQAMPFYQRLGYTAEARGDKYPDEGVPHQKMVKWLSA
ncbi:hypothetical protein EXIGLDRAFT_763531 [Exidia glandulosa HHB12029]|uniref:N-acetyltransferase domain-containing protein n=1 Tax=Exidia glandulosa HHB12029 TaxID=1314781 RepID=A0A165LVD5_EXIGL|nr:hypothetical protein EXIGLDRAFT_763531 [Exidia glandulosa HHB12029]